MLRAVVDVTLGVVDAVTGLPTVYRGAKVVVTGKVVGTILGLAGSDLRSMLSGPMRMRAAINCAFVRSMENPVLENSMNGRVVPGLVVQKTCKLAVSHTWLPTPQL